jgi:hypothetical protein
MRRLFHLFTASLAEAKGIEPTNLLQPLVFKTSSSSIRTTSIKQHTGFEPVETLSGLTLFHRELPSATQPMSFAQNVGIEPTREAFGEPTATLAVFCVIINMSNNYVDKNSTFLFFKSYFPFISSF